MADEKNGEKKSKLKLTPSEWLYLFLLEVDEIPDGELDEFWGLTSRHLQLIEVSKKEIPQYKRRVRDIIRVAKWSRRRREFIPYEVEKQLEFFSTDILLRKSINRGERELIATEIKRMEVTDLEKAPSKGIRAAVGKIFGGGG